jgi:hypothetical protein
MKKIVAITLGLCLLGLLSPSVTFAGKAKKAGKKAATAATNPLAKFDANNNGLLEDEEVTALEKDYADNKTEELKKYDTNNDGKIDSTEAAAAKTDFAAGAKKHHKKKNA